MELLSVCVFLCPPWAHSLRHRARAGPGAPPLCGSRGRLLLGVTALWDEEAGPEILGCWCGNLSHLSVAQFLGGHEDGLIDVVPKSHSISEAGHSSSFLVLPTVKTSLGIFTCFCQVQASHARHSPARPEQCILLPLPLSAVMAGLLTGLPLEAGLFASVFQAATSPDPYLVN